MKRIFSFALGNVWSWTTSKNRDNLIKYARKLDVSGVEITFASKEEVYAFKLSEENRAWLRQLDYVTIHAPFSLVRGSENEEEIIKQLNLISGVYNDINAKNVIIHSISLPSPEMLKEYNFNVSTENTELRGRVTIPDLKKILNQYPNIGLCLDVTHAYNWSKYETGNLVKAFKDRISQIHLSGTYKRKYHQSMRNVTKDFLLSIEPIKELNVPIVIEEDIKVKSQRYLKDEVAYIKSIFD
jgi:hypothetical protein